MAYGELTTQDALAELREMFPKGHLRAEAHAVEADKLDDPDGTSSTFAVITVSRATECGAKSFRGTSLSDCLTQARKWKETQS